MNSWGNRLSYAMRVRGMQKSLVLALAIGVNESTISRWRNSEPISVANAVGLAVALDVSLDWLLIGRGNIHSNPESLGSSDLEQIVQSASRLPNNVNKALLALIQSFSEI